MTSPLLAHIKDTTYPTLRDKKKDRIYFFGASVAWVLLWIYAFDILALA